MTDERPGQHGVDNSTPGRYGLYTQHDNDMGRSDGDAVDSTYSKNDVKSVNFQRLRNLQGTAVTFFYPLTSRSQQY